AGLVHLAHAALAERADDDVTAEADDVFRPDGVGGRHRVGPGLGLAAAADVVAEAAQPGQLALAQRRRLTVRARQLAGLPELPHQAAAVWAAAGVLIDRRGVVLIEAGAEQAVPVVGVGADRCVHRRRPPESADRPG